MQTYTDEGVVLLPRFPATAPIGSKGMQMNDNPKLRAELQEFDLMDFYSTFNNNRITLSILTSGDPSQLQFVCVTFFVFLHLFFAFVLLCSCWNLSRAPHPFFCTNSDLTQQKTKKPTKKNKIQKQ